MSNPMDASVKLIEVAKEPGVADLPIKVRGAFAKAIIAERLDDHDKAESELARAIELLASE